MARINLGIRRRLAPLLDGDRRRIELLNGLLMSLPGSPVIYYGDEIGMGDNIYLGDRNGVRTPMQWNGGWNAGFSGADPERLAFSRSSRTRSTATRRSTSRRSERNETSLLNWMQRLIAVRQPTRRCSAAARSQFLTPANHRVLAYLRTLDTRPGAGRQQPGGHGQAVELDLRELSGACRWRCSATACSRASASCPTCSRSARTPSTGSGCDASDDVPDGHGDAAPGSGCRIEVLVVAERSLIPDDLLRQIIAVGQADLLVGLPQLE